MSATDHPDGPLTRMPNLEAATGIPYDRLRKARARHPDAFPTEHVDGVAFHRPAAVARWMQQRTRGRPRTLTDDGSTPRPRRA